MRQHKRTCERFKSPIRSNKFCLDKRTWLGQYWWLGFYLTTLSEFSQPLIEQGCIHPHSPLSYICLKILLTIKKRLASKTVEYWIIIIQNPEGNSSSVTWLTIGKNWRGGEGSGGHRLKWGGAFTGTFMCLHQRGHISHIKFKIGYVLGLCRHGFRWDVIPTQNQ